jgi:hypothetical protein
MIQFANSYWPRSGGDRGNRSHASIPGAEQGKILLEVSLPRSYRQKKKRRPRYSGCVVTDEETLRVVSDRILSAVTFDGEIVWAVELKDAQGRFSPYCSLPVALRNGACALTLRNSLQIFDKEGELQQQTCIPAPLDNSGLSPNITYNDHFIITCITGEVFWINSPEIIEIGCFGYDIVPPAIYPDNSLAIAGYYATGFCRVHPATNKMWTTSLKEADLLPTINQHQIAAVGSLNDDISAFFSPEGKLLGQYAKAASFAEYSPNEWIALTEAWIAKLTLEGREIWRYPLQRGLECNWGQCQPVVDSVGRIYFGDGNAVVCLDYQGNQVFFAMLPEPLRGGLSVIAPGRIAFISDNRLWILK